MAVATTIPPTSAVPRPTTLLLLQLGGGCVAMLPIMSLNQFAKLSDLLYRLLLISGILNIILSAIILLGFLAQFPFLMRIINKIGEIGVCRAVIFYDIFMLGALVYLTG